MYKTKLSEKFVIAIFIAFNLWIHNAHAQDCNALDFPILTFVTFPITPGKLLEQPIEIRMANTNGVISHTENPYNNNPYLSFTYESNIVLVDTTDEFLFYERDQNNIELIATVRLTCADSQQTDMNVIFEFEDVNNWDPTFSKPIYEIEIPLPLPKDFEIFSFISERISAIDNDLKNNQVTFSSDITEPFTVSTSNVVGPSGKEFYATIRTTEKILNIRNGIEFTIIATDSGTNTIRTGTANVKLTSQRDDENPIEVPIFRKTLYIGTLDFRQPTPLQIETISLFDETFIPTIKFKTEFSDADYFKMIHVDGENAVNFDLDASITEETLIGETQLSFVVTATRPEDGLLGNTAVLITVIPRDSLMFDNILYTGTIKPDMTITHEPIKLTGSSYQTGVVFSIKEDILGWFEVVSNPNVNDIQIQLIRPLSDTDLEGKTLASLTILATSPGNTVLEAESHVVLGIEVAELIIPTFEFSFYEGSISTDLELQDLPELRLTTNIDIGNVEFTLSDYNDLFEAVKTTDGVQIIKKTLIADDVEDKNTLQFTVTATSDKAITGSTVVILTVEHEELILPVFAQQTYIGYLRRPISADSFELEEVILNSHPGVVQFELSGEDTHLIKIVSKEVGNRIVTLGLADGVTEVDIGDRNVLSVIVMAKLTETIIGSTVVIIHVDQEEIILKQPAFEKNIYRGSLTDSYELLMEDSEIKITQATFSDTIVFTEIGDDAQYFIVQKTNGVNMVEIEWNPIANLEELADRTSLSFSVVATSNEDQILTGTTTVVIELAPKVVSPEIIPAFVEYLYAGSLNADFTIDLEPIRITTGTITPGINYELIGFDSDLFDFDETIAGTIEISTNKITADILKTKQSFKFMVRAENEEKHVGITSVVIEVPRELVSDVIVPQFERSLYNGKMARDETVKLDEIIKISESTYSSNLKFTVDGGDSSLFEVTNQPGSNIIEVSMKLFDPSALQGKNVLYFAVIGTLTDNIIVTTSVVIDITPMVTLQEPKFAQPLYVGVLSAEMTFSIADLEITAGSYSSDLKFEKSGRDSGLFEMTEDLNKIKITPVRPITEDDIAYFTNLQFTVTATKPNGLYGSTAIVVDIPVKAIGDVILPQFESPYYKGVLTADFEIELSTVVLIDTTYNPKVQFAVTDEMFYLFLDTKNTITVIKSASFQNSAFKDKQFHSFAIIAHLGSTIQGTTTVILEIESPNEKLVPQFEESLYMGDLSADLIPSIPIIKLTEESYSTEVIFALEPGYDSNLFTLDTSTTGNLVQILPNGLTEDNTKLKPSLKFVLTATKSEKLIGNTVVVINNPNTIVDNIIVPKFDKLLYTGRISPDFALTIDDIIKITDATYSPLISYDIEGGNDLFKVAGRNGNLITIGLDRELQQSDINDKKVFSFTLVASLGDLAQSTAAIIIDIQMQNVILPPEFEYPLYVGSLTETLRLIIVDLKLTDESYSTNVNFELISAYDHNLFEIAYTGNLVSIDVKDLSEEDIKSKSALMILISATNSETNLVGTTVVIVEIQCTPIVPQFEEPLYILKLSTDLLIENIEPIKVTEATYSSDITIGLSGADQNLFTHDQNNNEIMLKTVRDLTTNDIENKQFLSLKITATLPTGEEGSTVVLIEIPFEGCHIPDETTRPKFENELYTNSIAPDATGVIRTVYAEVPSDPSIKVIYAVQIEDTGLSSKIEMNRDSGELSVTDRLAVAVYIFVLTATNPVDNTVGYATIQLTVTSNINCAGEPIVSHALIIRNLDEETPHTNIFDATVNVPNCGYSIVTVTPSSLRDIFEIDGNLLISQSFDRENIIFADMMIPQIRLMLEIVCTAPETLNGKYMSISYNQTRATRSVKDDLDDSYYIHTSDIERDDKKTIISIVIKDINDNDPIFEIPSSDILVGYPESQLAEKLLPPYLTKVYATDADDGINSKILYTIDPNLHFGIDGESGVIYPLKNSMDDTLEFDLIVKAIDEEGAGRETSLNIKVKRLEEKNFIVISIENESLDNLDTILRQIETQSGLRINVLNAVIVSTATEVSTELRSKRSTIFADGEQTILRIVGYAFNVDGVPIENEELETKLSGLTTAYIITTQSIIELIGNCGDPPVCPTTDSPDDCEIGDCDECDNIGLIVGIIVIAILFLLACIACFVMWWKWIRPYRYIKRDSTNDRLDHDFNDAGYTEPVRPATAPLSDSDILGKSNFEIKNENTPTEVTPTIPHSSPTSLAKSLQSVLDQESRKPSLVLDKDNLSGSSETDDSGSPPLRERKKSIKFNETVERIDILDDVIEKEDTIF